ncbi:MULTISPECIES: lipase family protein [Gordonia]|nr:MULTISPECIES: lipase family protein [Gordonia]MDH3005652.1 lipase family protein [Gordonia alkanivorans]MDH3011034.1 lipase family protein [Gordonia alkanivorans]MDH3019934.1 lipase family protein [Gordonia alkanivorans]MDH3026003.1 lipase family protein [Gordonia alkanivorans]MDH3042951.1 lipase family protein [Gordonia alkanivorans]
MTRASNRRRFAAVVAAMTTALVVSGCGAAGFTDDPSLNSAIPLAIQSPPDLVTPYPEPIVRGAADTGGPGAVLAVADPPRGPIPVITELGAIVKRVEYRSTSGLDRSPTVVSGIVVTPKGEPPPGGWTTIAFGHGTTGVLDDCGPSEYVNLIGSDEIIAALVLNGFAVAMSDYEGLGMRDVDHPFLDARTYGYNMIDAVRAARGVFPGLGRKWISYGVSLGGMASWAAGELAPTYGGGLDLLGTVALVPVSDMTGLVERAEKGTLTADQVPMMAYLIDSLARVLPDEFDRDDYRSEFLRKNWSEVLRCIPIDVQQTQRVLNSIGVEDVAPHTPEAAARLRDHLAATSLPVGRATAPMLIMYGTEDPLIAAPWTERAIRRSCTAGSPIQAMRRIGETHAQLDSGQSVAWMKSLESGWKPPQNCGDRP